MTWKLMDCINYVCTTRLYPPTTSPKIANKSAIMPPS